MSIFILFIYIVSVFVAIRTNTDIFSPAKYYLLNFLVFYSGAWFEDQEIALWGCILLVLLIGSITVALESGIRPFPRRMAFNKESLISESLTWWLWLLSLPGILSQLYIVTWVGGIEDYINILHYRVEAFSGLGWVRILTQTLSVINLVYFSLGLMGGRPLYWWSGFTIHLLLTASIGILSGSRSGLLNIFVSMLFCFHYLRFRIPAIYILMFAFTLVLTAGIMGALREQVKVSEGEFYTSSENEGLTIKTNIFFNGVEPLEILIKSELEDLAWGSTFLTAFTHLIPRVVWPGKPDSGGVFFTKIYTGDAWQGRSNLAPTFLGELVINFDWAAGIFMFIILYCLIMVAIVKLYNSFLKSMAIKSGKDLVLSVVWYNSILFAGVALMTGEFTNTLHIFFLTKAIPLILLRRIFRLAIKFK